ncbi:MAG: hypothetical protein K0S00_4460 [Xanthobacteraceae bacterium]|jgi:hypothetical protein|nr:hypothetical protein [Xanthobacteraceae bacterium]
MTQTDAHVDPVRLAELHKEYGEYPGHLELSWVRGTATLGEFLGLIDRAMQAATAGGAVKVKDWLQVAKLAGEHGIRYRTNRALERFLSDILSALEPATATAQEGADADVTMRGDGVAVYPDGREWTPTPAPEPGSVEGLVERLRGFHSARAAFVAALNRYNERLAYEKKLGEFPPRMGNLYEEMEDAKSEWLKAAQALADDGKANEAADALTTLQQQLAALRETHRLDRQMIDANRRRAERAEQEVAAKNELMAQALEAFEFDAHSNTGWTFDEAGQPVKWRDIAWAAKRRMTAALAAKSAGGGE